MLGLGVYQARAGNETQNAVKLALKHGYRLIDTARLYGNERDVGLAVKQSGIKREEIFVTTKLWNSDHGYEQTKRAFKQSLQNLGSIDLYLIHWPVPELRNKSWKAMTELQEEGQVRAIGVSNYTIEHLEELSKDSSVVPSVNQVEFHPFLYQKGLLEYCKAHKIQLEAYSPLTRGQGLRHPTIVEIAKKYSKTPAQIMVRWGLQHDVVEIPKSVHENRIVENSQVFDFEISGKDMASLDSLSEGLHYDWDPTGSP